MPSVLDQGGVPAPARTAQVTGAPADAEPISTQEAAALMGFSDATLRNYAWLNSLSSEERTTRKLQEPPAGLPVPSRKSGRLVWPLCEVLKFAEQKSKNAP